MPNGNELKENKIAPEILPTEEEVRRLREELQAKEAELAHLREIKKGKIEAIFPKEAERKIEKEKEEILAVKEKPIKVPPKRIVPGPKIKEEDIAMDLKRVMSLAKPRQVKVLIYFAFKKGLNYAALIAQKLKDPYILDEFHDTLIDELYEILKKRKKIKE